MQWERRGSAHRPTARPTHTSRPARSLHPSALLPPHLLPPPPRPWGGCGGAAPPTQTPLPSSPAPRPSGPVRGCRWHGAWLADNPQPRQAEERAGGPQAGASAWCLRKGECGDHGGKPDRVASRCSWPLPGAALLQPLPTERGVVRPPPLIGPFYPNLALSEPPLHPLLPDSPPPLLCSIFPTVWSYLTSLSLPIRNNPQECFVSIIATTCKCLLCNRVSADKFKFYKIIKAHTF